MIEDLKDVELGLLRPDICPDCRSPAGFETGPRGVLPRTGFAVDGVNAQPVQKS
jgi:hypothetical protein